MKARILKTFVFLIIGALFFGCAAKMANKDPLEFSSPELSAEQYTPKVENFLFILDTSSSMDLSGGQNLMTAKNLISAINQSLPNNLTFNAGLRTFGHPTEKSGTLTDLAYGMTPYTRSGLQNGLDSVTYAGGPSPLPKAIAAAGKDLQGTQGKSALIIISDGLIESDMSDAPAALAKLKGEMGNKLCTYTIAVGSNPTVARFIQKVTEADGCGFSENAATLTALGPLESFVTSVFLERKEIPVAQAAPTAVVVPIDGDADGDGVLDSRDQCPDTLKRVIVDEYGCTLKLALHINFDFDKSDIKPEFTTELKKAGDFILRNKDVPYILITGFTDSVGKNIYNQNLSKRRAAAVKQYLIDNFDIDPKRLIARGSGESNPMADNRTKAGRAENRRGEIICCAAILPET